MAFDERVVEQIREVLAGRNDVLEKRMVGGRSFMVMGHLCCGVAGSAVMVRVGPLAYERALAEANVRPMAFRDKPLTGYVCVDPAGYATRAQLAAWVQRALDYVSTLAESEATTSG
jgi:hypothetical protein